MKKYHFAVVGATGAVGTKIIETLPDYGINIAKVYPLASSRSKGKKIKFLNEELVVQDLAEFDFSVCDIAFFSAGADVSKIYAPIAAKAGCVVIDNTSCFRYNDDIPLIVPEVNPQALKDYKKHNIIANPNCSTIQMVVALKPIYDAVGIKRINVATYQAVSGSGTKAINELHNQNKKYYAGNKLTQEDCQAYPHQIAFNVLPQIDVFMPNGYTKEEMKMVWETQKIFNDENILVNPTCVRVPVIYGHSEAVHIETEEKIKIKELFSLLQFAKGVKLFDNTNSLQYPTAAEQAENNDFVYVGRIRKDISSNNGINLWIVSDNIRKGASTNSIQIAQYLIKNKML